MASFGRRIDGVSGRRAAARNPVLLPAAITSPTRSGMVDLVNISSTGASLRCEAVPSLGQDILIRTDKVEAFGSVVWVRRDLCGVHFDAPVDELTLRLLKRESQLYLRANISPQERLAAEDWSSGYAR